MPIFANITVKKADGTTDVVYTAVQRSSGDMSPARYEQQTPSVPSLRPQFTIQAGRPSGAGNLRNVVVNGVYPIADPVTGLEIGRVTLNGARITTPRGASEASIAEGVHQLLNLAASTAVKQSSVEGYAP